jgi:hypothetical protein
VPGEVVFLFDARRHAMTVEDAEGLLGYVADANLAALWLHSEIRTAVRTGSGEITLEPEHRDELLRVHSSIEAPTGSERALRLALSD